MAHTPTGPARPVAGVRVQLDEGSADGLGEGWAAETAELPEARNVDRLLADADLITTLALAGFVGTQYDYFAGELAKYGVAVIGSWVRRGIILARVRERGFGGLPAPPPGAFDDDEVVADLTHETVVRALNRFRQDVLLKQKWDATRGATIRTYFIGQCLMRFPNVYRSWLRTGRRPELVVDHFDVVDLSDGRYDGPEASTIVEQEIERGLALAASDHVRRVLLLSAGGWPHAEIAEELGVTAKSVEKTLYNHASRMRQMGTV
jgi:DNA-directed RNA polymerase specialized sigma24 family protein